MTPVLELAEHKLLADCASAAQGCKELHSCKVIWCQSAVLSHMQTVNLHPPREPAGRRAAGPPG